MTDEFGRISGARAGFQAPSSLTAMSKMGVALPPCVAPGAVLGSQVSDVRAAKPPVAASLSMAAVLVCAEIGERQFGQLSPDCPASRPFSMSSSKHAL